MHKGQKRLATLVMQKEDLVALLEESNKVLVTTVIPMLNETIKEVKDETVLSKNVAFSSYKAKSDKDIFNMMLNVVEKFSNATPLLISKIVEFLPDVINTGSGNINLRIAISVASEVTFFAERFQLVLCYILDKFYLKDKSELSEDYAREIAARASIIIKTIPELNKADINAVIAAIGNVPTLRTISDERNSHVPSELVMGFFAKTFNIKDFYTKTFLSRILKYFSYKDAHKHHKDIAKSFIGNPIYHLRMMMVDFEVMKFEGLKEKRRLLELKIIELKNRGVDNPKIKKQVNYYEDKLNKLNLKIDHIVNKSRK